MRLFALFVPINRCEQHLKNTGLAESTLNSTPTRPANPLEKAKSCTTQVSLRTIVVETERPLRPTGVEKVRSKYQPCK